MGLSQYFRGDFEQDNTYRESSEAQGLKQLKYDQREEDGTAHSRSFRIPSTRNAEEPRKIHHANGKVINAPYISKVKMGALQST